MKTKLCCQWAHWGELWGRVAHRVMVVNATFNNISIISRQSILLVEVLGENHRPVNIDYIYMFLQKGTHFYMTAKFLWLYYLLQFKMTNQNYLMSSFIHSLNHILLHTYKRIFKMASDHMLLFSLRLKKNKTLNRLSRYNWNIIESGINHHNPLGYPTSQFSSMCSLKTQFGFHCFFKVEKILLYFIEN
jgi:hypothetical protein